MKEVKRITLMIISLLVSVAGFAQQEVGSFNITPIVGMSMGDYGIKTASSIDYVSHKTTTHVGFVGGVEGGLQVSKWFEPTIGAVITNVGTDLWTYDKDDRTFGYISTTYVNIPVLANVYLAKGLALKAGLEPSLLVMSKSKKCYFDDEEKKLRADDYQKFDLIVPVGISYEYSNIILDARYNLGTMHVLREKEGQYKEKFYNQYMTVTLGYKFKI